MNALKTANPLVLVIGGIVVGLLLGLIIFWGLIPPKATDVAPVLLQSGYRDYYLSLVAKEFSVTKDVTQAKNMLGADREGWSSKQIVADLKKLSAAPGRADKVQLDVLAAELDKGSAPAPAPAAGGTNWTLIIVSLLALLTLAVVFVVFLLPRLRGPQELKPGTSAAVRSAQASKAVETTTWAGEEVKPLAQFVTAYEIGDDRYDLSFSVETPTGDFLGECGVGISETLGQGSPDKVTALEVWLFDKNDIRTVTKVLMSDFAYGDQALRAKLAPKGEPELAQPNAAVELETATLKLRARVVDMEYGLGDLPPRSFFNKLSLELAAWPKEAPAPVPAA